MVTKLRQLEPLVNVTMNRSWRTFKVRLGRQIALTSISGGTSGRKYSLGYLTNMPQSSAVMPGETHCLGLTRRRNKLRRLANETVSEEAWRNYRTLRNKVTLNLRRGKHAYFESLVSKSSTTTRDVWKQLNRLLGRNRGAGSAVNLEHGDNIASRLSDHFSGFAATVLHPDQPPIIPQYSSSFHFNCISEEDVLCALSKLDLSKATGADALSTRILRTTAPAISSSLCKLFNYSLKTSQIPTEWKAANVIPVPKSVNA